VNATTEQAVEIATSAIIITTIITNTSVLNDHFTGKPVQSTLATFPYSSTD